MNDPYLDLVQPLQDGDEPFKALTIQLAFLLYLVVGQVVVLLAWKLLVRRPGRPSRGLDVAFAVYLLLAQAGLFFAWPWLVRRWQTADPILLADVVVTIHLGFVLAVLLTLLVVLAGWPLGWTWTRNFWFRLAQLVAIEVVAGQAIVELECPLTTLERHLRGGPGFLHELENASALGRFCNDILYHAPPPEMRYFFAIVYAAVALLVLSTWVLVPPHWPGRRLEEPGDAAASPLHSSSSR